MEANAISLEELLRNPPSLQQVLEDPLMHSMLQWHLVVSFAPENLLFRDSVKQFEAYLGKGEVDEARTAMKSIIDTFMDPSSAFEVSHAGIKLSPTAEPESGMFDAVMDHVDRDLSRSLQTLWPTAVFKSYLEHKNTLQKIHMVSRSSQLKENRPSGQNSPSSSDPLSAVRTAYGVREKLLMKRYFEVGSPYLYRLCTASAEDTIIGYCRQVEGDFVFYDAAEHILLETPAAELLGRSSLPKTPRPVTPMDDTASTGCFGGRARKSSVPAAVDDPRDLKWFVKTAKGEEVGPFSYVVLSLWWKYHLLDLSCTVRHEKGNHEPINTCSYFSPADQIQLIDPTALTQLGASGLHL